MPHRHHRQRRQLRENKRVVTEDEDGWSHVTTKGQVSGHIQRETSIEEAILSPRRAEISGKRLHELYNQHALRWKNSEARRIVLSIFKAERNRAQITVIKKSLCVGLGSLSSRVSIEMAPITQLVAWLDICREGKS